MFLKNSKFCIIANSSVSSQCLFIYMVHISHGPYLFTISYFNFATYEPDIVTHVSHLS